MQHKDSADITGKDVDSYFEESSQKRSYNCYNCNKSLIKLTIRIATQRSKSRKTLKQSELFVLQKLFHQICQFALVG